MARNFGISIIIPAYNEESGIKEVVERCKKVLQAGDEIIVVDDGSKDQTFQIASTLGIKVIQHEKNKGKVGALYTGFAAAKNDVLITIDADNTYPPELIPEMMDSLGDFDMVVGTRFRKMWPKNMPFHRVAANKLGAIIASIIVMKKLTDVTSGFRGFRKSMISQLKIHATGLDFEAELTAKAITKGYKYYEIPIAVEERRGVSNLHFFQHMWEFFIAILRGRFID